MKADFGKKLKNNFFHPSVFYFWAFFTVKIKIFLVPIFHIEYTTPISGVKIRDFGDYVIVLMYS